MHKLLILGSLDEFVELIEMAKSRGYDTIVCDGYKGSVGKSHGDKVYDIDVGDTKKIAEMCKEEGVDGIITSFSDYLFQCMVEIAQEANLKCYFDVEHLPYYRDKTKMKDMLAQLEIGTAAYCYVEKDFQDEQLAHLKFPVVVKPVDKYGSRGVQVLYSIEEIREQFDYTCATSDIKKILVEEYNDGYEFNMMTWVLNGQVQVISIADREKSPRGKHEIPISSRNVYPSNKIEDVYEQAREILQKVADYTGQKQGALSMQFFWKPEEGIEVCEVAGRFFGYEHELVELAGGLNIEKLLLDYVYEPKEVEKTFAHYTPFFEKNSAVLYFHGMPEMVVDDQSVAEELAKHPAVVMSQIFYKKGEQVVEHGPNPYMARYYITADTREKLDEITKYFFDTMTIKDATKKEVLYRNVL